MDKWFDKKLYQEAFRQGRMIGLTTLLLLILEAVLIPIGHYIEYSKVVLYTDAIGSMNGVMDRVPQELGIFSLHPMIVTTYLIATPLMVLWLFHFLTKRNASDFFHAIPKKRTCMFFSYFSAILSWSAIYTIVPVLVNVGVSALFMKTWFIVDYASVWQEVFISLSLNFYIASVFSIAVSLCGTVFSALAVAGLILISPFLFIMAGLSALESLVVIVPIDQMPLYVMMEHNLLLGRAFTYLVNGSMWSADWGISCLYTLGVGSAFTAIGAWLFHRRPSEAAGNAALNEKVQMAIRLLLAMLVCLIPLTGLTGVLLAERVLEQTESFGYFIMFLCAIIVYFLYELLSRRSGKSLLRSIKTVWLLLPMNLLYLAVITGCFYTMLDVPKEEEIQSISIGMGIGDTYMQSERLPDYFNELIKDVPLTDPSLISLTAEVLERDAEEIRSGSRNYYYDHEADMLVTIRTKKGTIKRTLFLTEEQYHYFLHTAAQNEKVKQAFQQLPEYRTGKTVLELMKQGAKPLTKEEEQKLYDTFVEEAKSLDVDEWIHFVQRNRFYGEDIFMCIYFTDRINGKDCASVVALQYEPNSPFKKTFNMYFELMENGREEEKEALDHLRSYVLDGNGYAYLQVYIDGNVSFGEIIDLDSFYWQDKFQWKISEEELIELLEKNVDRKVVYEEPFALIYIESYHGEYSEVGNYYYNLSGIEEYITYQ